MTGSSILLLLLTLCSFSVAIAQTTTKKEKPTTLKHWMTPEEAKLKHLIGRDAQATDPPAGPVTNFAEFDQVQSVLIRYQFGISYQLIAAMSQKCGVITIVASTSEQNTVTNQYQNQGVNLANCTFIIAPTNSYWTRDYGPWFVFDGNDDIGIVDFEYNRPRPLDNAIPLKVSQHLGVNYYKTDLKHTGGNYMTDGMGISASTDIVHTENTNLTQAQIAQIMLNYYGIHTYHVRPDPNNTYIDHIDCWAKYLAPDKILIRSVPNTHPQYNAIEATVAYFAAQTSSYGTPLEVIRVYTPNNQPYTNSLILNDRVFVPIMNSSWDAAAIQTYKDAMPGYEVLGFTGSWESTDALHCRTIGITNLQKVHIRHVPLSGEQPVQPGYPVEAVVKAFSGQPLKSDSVLIYYRVNGQSWQTVNMTNTGSQTWSGTIPAAASGSQVDYYLFAADQANKRIKHPFIGAPDPHSFSVGAQAFAQITVNPDQLSGSATAGSSTTEMLTICNVGTLPLYFTIGSNTAVYEDFSVPVTSSPATNAYDYNTLIEAEWTTIPVAFSGEIASVEVNYTWTTDDWPEEGSFYLESPSGTSVLIASGSPGGTYSSDMNSFNGQDVNGEWKIWIEDSYGDGGHRATGITVKFTLVVSENEWLGINPMSGEIQPGNCLQISVLMDATDLEARLYSGELLISSNDPDQSVIEVPVEFEVTAVQDVVVTPDTLWFLTYNDMINGKMFNIHNPTASAIAINEITEWGSNFAWTVENLVALPYQLPGGADLELKVVIVPPPQNLKTNLLFDDLHVTTANATHTVVIAWDSDLIATNMTLDPDTLWFTDPATIIDPRTVTFSNVSNVPVTLYEIQMENLSAPFAWMVQNVSEPLPYMMMPGEFVTFDVYLLVPVTNSMVTLQYDSIPITSDAGVDFLTLVCDTDLLSSVNSQQSNGSGVYPNPFFNNLNVKYFNEIPQNVKVELIDLHGKIIFTLHNGILPSGNQTFSWDGRDDSGNRVKNGIWFVRISTPQTSTMIKVLKMN